MIRKCYPGGKGKVFTLSYDDGVKQDVRLVALLNRYGIKGTFNLNYGLMHQNFTWIHECGMEISRLSEGEITQLYQGHEIASHSFSHPYFDNMREPEILKELASDKFFLEKVTEQEISGFATPFYHYSDLMASCVRQCGFAYGRISEESNDFSVPADVYRWRGSKFHWDADLFDFVDRFLDTDQELALCQIVGHSYDLDVMNLWEPMERLYQKVSRAEDVWFATHIEIVRYLQGMEKARISHNEIKNESNAVLWFAVDSKTVSLQPGGKIELE